MISGRVSIYTREDGLDDKIDIGIENDKGLMKEKGVVIGGSN